MKPAHVLHLIDGLNVGGAEVLLRDLTAGLVQRGYRVSVGYSTPGPLVEELRANGIKLTRLPRLARVDPLLMLGMLRLINSDPPQVVHTHLFKSDFHGRLAARLAGVPVVISTLHNADRWAEKWPLGVLYGGSARFADQLIAVSEEVRQYHLQKTAVSAEKLMVINNGVDVGRFNITAAVRQQLRAEFKISTESVLFGVIGRLKPQKDHNTFLDAAALILREVPSARFLVIGDGPLRAELEQRAAVLGLLPALIFTGLRNDIPQLLAALDVLIFSSLWEGLPVTLLEAMAAVKPVVATAVNGIAGVAIEDVTALLVNVADPAALSAACVRLARDPGLRLRLGQAGFRRVSEFYSLETMINQISSLYNDLLFARGLSAMIPSRLSSAYSEVLS